MVVVRGLTKSVRRRRVNVDIVRGVLHAADATGKDIDTLETPTWTTPSENQGDDEEKKRHWKLEAFYDACLWDGLPTLITP